MLSSQVPTLAHVSYDCHTELTALDYLEKYLIITVKYLTAAAQIIFDRSIITRFLPLSDVRQL